MVASSLWRLTGFVRWASKPAFWERSTSSCMPKPVSAMAGVFQVSLTFLMKSMPLPSGKPRVAEKKIEILSPDGFERGGDIWGDLCREAAVFQQSRQGARGVAMIFHE